MLYVITNLSISNADKFGLQIEGDDPRHAVENLLKTDGSKHSIVKVEPKDDKIIVTLSNGWILSVEQ